MSAAAKLGRRKPAPIPARAGVGLKPEHYRDVIDAWPDVGWFEVHPENYMGAGGWPHHVLERVRARYPLSMHGVGLSIGGADPLNRQHVDRLADLVRRYEPALISEHLAWSTHEGHFLNDLLPLPYHEATLAHVSRHVNELQTALNRRVLIENPSTYVTFTESDMAEVDFLKELVRRTGCGLLLDCNNVHVCATNHHFDAVTYIDTFPVEHAGEIHLAGYAEIEDDDGSPLLIDAHDRTVRDAVWALYRRVIERAGAIPTLIEWDNDVPAWSALHAEAMKADRIMRASTKGSTRAA
jgi:uncharacterized protein (UPF0276 family)